MKNQNSMRTWAAEELPSVKFEKNGVQTLTNSELLAILLGCGTKDADAVSVARDILARCEQSLRALGRMDIKDLASIKGIGRQKAMRILSAYELKRRTECEEKNTLMLGSSRQVADIMSAEIGSLPVEEFWVLYVNHSNKIVSRKRISRGGIDKTCVDVRVIMKEAVILYATGIILCHNHPSGECDPSDADRSLTKQLVAAANVLDIRVLDHIIVSEDSYYSFCDNMML